MIARYSQISAKYYQLFGCIKFSLKLILIAFINIIIRLFIYNFKDNIFNLYFSLGIYYNFSINIILALYLTSFNYHLARNYNLSM